MGDKVESERRAGCNHSVGTSIVCSIQGTILSTSDRIWTEVGVPGVAGVTVFVVTDFVGPPPVRIDDNALLL